MEPVKVVRLRVGDKVSIDIAYSYLSQDWFPKDNKKTQLGLSKIRHSQGVIKEFIVVGPTEGYTGNIDLNDTVARVEVDGENIAVGIKGLSKL